MACPTCGHTMHRIVERHFWCPRCGSLLAMRVPGMPDMDVSVPSLVERCREFQEHNILLNSYKAAWRQTGIQEAISLPEGRP